MSSQSRGLKFLIFYIVLSLGATGALAQKEKKEKSAADYPNAKAVIWESVNIKGQDLYTGPGGDQLKPDLGKITFIDEDKQGHNKKYRIKDGSGREWVAKLGSEAQPETAAVRLLYGLGYKTEINYLIPSLTIPGKGTFSNVRLEARPNNVKRLDSWKWRQNPFVDTNQLQALKIMMVFLANYDLLDMQNKVLHVKDPNGDELQYIISDLGATFGRLGNNNLPIIYRIGRKDNDPVAWSKAGFISGMKDGRLNMAYTGGKSRGIMDDITVGQGRWLYNLLSQLDDRQINDAFRAANYSPDEIKMLTQAVKERITALDDATKTASVTDAKF